MNILIVGVGGQGTLLTSRVLGKYAEMQGMDCKLSEVHGMSQRGGDVQSDLRLSTEAIHSDQIPVGGADLIISMEPIEALRYLPYLHEEGWVVTSSRPLVNIPNYPDAAAVADELAALPHVATLDIETVARDNGVPRGANMVLLGMAARYFEILTADQLRTAIRHIFARKGEQVVADNLKAFELGYGQPA